MEHLTPTKVSLRRPWRAQGDAFDELVVGSWLHVEDMGDGHMWMRVGPLVINVTERALGMDMRIHRESDEHLYRVTIDGDLTQDQATEHDLRLRVLAAYEAARDGDRRREPGADRLRWEIGRRMAVPAARRRDGVSD
jgi:hypothetical protein